MELLIYNENRNLIGILETYEYLYWTRRYSQSGAFELKAMAGAANLELLQIGNILWKNDDAECGFIEHIELTSGEQEHITVSGRFATGLLARRIVWNTETLSGDIGAAIGQLLTNHVVSPSDTSRCISGISYISNNHGISVTGQVSYKNLYTAVTDICAAADMGIKTVFEAVTGNLAVSLYNGVASQAVFAREFDNINEQSFIQSNTNSASIALVGGEGEGAARTFVTVGGGSGIDRRELFVDAKDLQSADFSSGYTEALMCRGNEKLAGAAPVRSFDAAVNPYGNLCYKVDYDLGQIVTVKSEKWGVSMTTRIIEIIENYDVDGLTLEVTFGRGMLMLSQKLREVIG